MPRKKNRTPTSPEALADIQPSATPTPAAAARRPRRNPLGGFPIHWVALILCVAALVGTRLYSLDYMGFHHDESIHCLHSWNFVNNAKGPASYRYDPVYHGPFLYHFGALFFTFAQEPAPEGKPPKRFYTQLLNDSDFTARLPFAFIGIVFPLIFLLWRRHLGWGPCLVILGLLVLSPAVNYFSRFARNDVYMTGWMTGMLVFGTLYLFTKKTRHLTAVVLFLTLSYCTKENSYVNTFGLCSFLVLWGLWRILRYRMAALEEILVDNLPLVRLLLLVGCFAVFVFSYVAIDCRVGPNTPLLTGLKTIAAHSTSIEKKEDATVFANQMGYFSGPNREAVKQRYFRLAFATTILLLLLAEGFSHFFESRRGGASVPLRTGLGVFVAALFYGALGERVLAFATWTKTATRAGFFLDLPIQLGMILVLLWGAGLLFVLPGLLFRPPGGDLPQGGRLPALWRDSRVRLFGILGLGLQVVLALGLYTLLFSSLGTNAPRGTQDGLYQYLSYWFKHQTGDYRIWGPWWYYLPRILFFEIVPVVLGLLFLGAIGFRFAGRLSAGLRQRREALAQGSTPSPSLLTRKDPPPEHRYWKPIPSPLLAFSAYLFFFLVGIYAILNEKVPWLLTYQAFAVALFAAVLASHWMASRPVQVPASEETVGDAGGDYGARSSTVPPGPFIDWLMDIPPQPVEGGRSATLPYAQAIGKVAILLAVLGALAFSIGQHAATVFIRPDQPTEFLVYTQTTHGFAEEIRRIRSRLEAAKTEGKKLRLAVQGDSEWPCAWYFRNDDVAWKQVDLSRDIQIADDTPEIRRQLTPRSGHVWDIRPVLLRGWYIWHGTPKALPGELLFGPNVKAFLFNSSNPTREYFPVNNRPKAEGFTLGFRDQLFEYMLRRKVWYPVGGHQAVVAYKTDQPVPESESRGFLEGSNGQVVPLATQASFGVRGSLPGQLLEPRGLDLTPAGDIAVADSKNGRISIFSEQGEFLRSFGEGKLSSDVSGVCDLDCTPQGEFYVADTWNRQILKFSPEGEVIATGRKALHNRLLEDLYGPRGIAVAPDGRVYVTDTGNKKVRVFDARLIPLFSWGGNGEGPGQFKEPVGIAIDSAGDVYVADTGNGRIQRFDKTGSFVEQYLTQVPLEQELNGVEPHLECLPDGRLVTTLSNSGTVWVIDPKGLKARIWKVSNPILRTPLGVALGQGGEVWIADRSTSQVVRVKFP